MRANNTRQLADREPAKWPPPSPAPRIYFASSEKKPSDPTREIEALRRENQELRGQLLQLMAAAAPPTSKEALPAEAWLDAQLKHCRRQVKLLSDALVCKAEVTGDLHETLRQILKSQPPPSQQHAQFCRTALRRLKGVDFAEEVAQQYQDNEPAPARGGGRGGGRGVLGHRLVQQRGADADHGSACSSGSGRACDLNIACVEFFYNRPARRAYTRTLYRHSILSRFSRPSRHRAASSSPSTTRALTRSAQ